MVISLNDFELFTSGVLYQVIVLLSELKIFFDLKHVRQQVTPTVAGNEATIAPSDPE